MVGLVLGIANEHSIAAGCATQLARAGARLAATYPNDKAKPYVEAVTRAVPCELLLPCDVREAGALESVFGCGRHSL
jgi:enoyl-[acyl-carrier protein] reductase I